MSIAIERVIEATAELRDLIGELDAVLGAAYEPHQRHGLSIAALFEPHVRFFVARLDGVAAGCGGVALFDDYAEVKRMYTRPAARGRGLAKAVLRRIEEEARAAGNPCCGSKPAHTSARRSGFIKAAGSLDVVRSATTRKCRPATSN
jgi:GNAT superfamily N-acetyltransferase